MTWNRLSTIARPGSLLPRIVAGRTNTVSRSTLLSATSSLKMPELVRQKSGPFGYTQAKALVFSKYGNPEEVLSLHTHSISPTLPDGHVLVRTLATAVNPSDITMVQGLYAKKPAFTKDLGTTEPSAVPGNEAVFEVTKVGAHVKSVKPGDWVLPNAPGIGTWRTHMQVPEEGVFVIDKTNLTPTQAATVSVNPATAYRLLRSYGAMGSPKKVDPEKNLSISEEVRFLEPGSGAYFIQNGANSGVGRAAIQLGKLWGLRSINVVRSRPTEAETEALKQELTDLGATVVITEDEFTTREWTTRLAELTKDGREPVTLGLNCVGGKSAMAMARSLSQDGTLVTYGAMARQPIELPMGQLIFKNIHFIGFWLTRWHQQHPELRQHDIRDLLELIRQGKLKDVPLSPVTWSWDTPAEELAHVVQSGMDGFRKGKSVFVFKET